MNSSLSQPSSSSSSAGVQEFSIRVPKAQKKRYNVMRFNRNLDIDFTKWNTIKMERENNRIEKNAAEEMPKYGAGSEYRKEEKEEARRKRLGLASRRYNPDNQPWILKCGGKNGKKYRGIREGGVGENAAYYVFMHGSNNVIEAFPVSEWYNFSATQRFKALSAEEAEQEFGKRNKSITYVTNMMRKRFRKDEEEELEEEGKRSKTRKDKEFKISDMDDWVDSGEESDDDSADNEDSEIKKPKKDKKKTQTKRKIVNDDESAVEESDDGDEEGRELDYISDSSESVSDDEAKVGKEMKSVAEEGALRKLLTSDEEDEENDEKTADETAKMEPVDKLEEDSSNGPKKNRKRKLSPSPNKIKNEPDSSSDVGAESSDSEATKNDQSSGLDMQSGTNYKPVSKKFKLDASSSDNGISEEAVRRYLARKPMTTTELLQKFKKPRTNLNSDKLVNVMTLILKKINPHKQTIKDKMYLSLKPDASQST